MDINDRKGLHSLAKQRLGNARDCPKIVLIFAALITGIPLISNLISLFLSWQISGSTGLSGMGFRSMLSTLQTMLPLLINIFLLAMGLGFTGAMLRISRGQYTSPKSMKIGLDRFWVLIRATLLQSLLYAGAMFAAFYVSELIFELTPLSNSLIRTAAQVMEGGNTDPLAMMEDPTIVMQLTKAMFPLFILTFIAFLCLAFPIGYHLRLVNYILIDKPGQGAFQSMKESFRMMRGNCLRFFMVDLSMWWYYAAIVLSLVVCYGDLILSACGVALPMAPATASIIFLIAYLLILFLVTLFLEPHVQVTYALCYESLRPKEQPSGGVVLGNIFNM